MCSDSSIYNGKWKPKYLTPQKKCSFEMQIPEQLLNLPAHAWLPIMMTSKSFSILPLPVPKIPVWTVCDNEEEWKMLLTGMGFAVRYLAWKYSSPVYYSMLSWEGDRNCWNRVVSVHTFLHLVTALSGCQHLPTEPKDLLPFTSASQTN